MRANLHEPALPRIAARPFLQQDPLQLPPQQQQLQLLLRCRLSSAKARCNASKIATG